jgi:hypothetical protein
MADSVHKSIDSGKSPPFRLLQRAKEEGRKTTPLPSQGNNREFAEVLNTQNPERSRIEVQSQRPTKESLDLLTRKSTPPPPTASGAGELAAWGTGGLAPGIPAAAMPGAGQNHPPHPLQQ